MVYDRTRKSKVIIIKYAATSITTIRIIGAISLLTIEPLSVFFYVVYFVCGISDILDGYIARKMNAVSKVGATLASNYLAEYTKVVRLSQYYRFIRRVQRYKPVATPLFYI